MLSFIEVSDVDTLHFRMLLLMGLRKLIKKINNKGTYQSLSRLINLTHLYF